MRPDHGGRWQLVPLWRVIEISGELDFLVADRGNFGQSAIEVSLQLIAHAVELHAELIDLVVRRSPAHATGEQRGCGNRRGGLKERAAIHHGISSGVGSERGPLYARKRSEVACAAKWKGAAASVRTPPADVFYFGGTTRLLVTEKTPDTLLARTPAKFLSPSLSTTPSRVTLPFFTMMRIGFCTPRAYFSSAG